jgi:3',5'-cyclic-AMP phosphodiesterase
MRERPLKGKFDAAGNLETCIAQLNALKPDLVLATGDLVNKGTPAEYTHLRELLAACEIPFYLLPGNHDDRGLMREFFPKHDYLFTDNERLHYIIECDGLNIIMLDSSIPNGDEGNIGEAQLAWLEGKLAGAPQTPALIALHHPPFATGVRYIDNFFCADGPQLRELVARHPNVLRVVSGHLHRNIQVNYAHAFGSVCPSTAVTFGLAIAPKTPFFYSTEPPGYHLHLWQPGKPIITHTVLLPPAALANGA